jgi:hypothetical protein
MHPKSKKNLRVYFGKLDNLSKLQAFLFHGYFHLNPHEEEEYGTSNFYSASFSS